MVPIMSQFNPVHTILYNLSKILFNITHPTTSWCCYWSLSFWLSDQNPICIPLSPCVLKIMIILSSIFWEVTRNQVASGFTLVSCLAYFLPWRWRRYIPPKCWLIFNGLHGVIFQNIELFITNPCGGRFEYLHRDPASRRRRRKGKSRIWDSKIWSRVLRDSDPRMTALARASNNCKRQTRPLIRENAPHEQTRNCRTVTKIWT
jgi:hypothetical protein